MKWEYKNITNMSAKEQKDFAKDPHKWMQDQLKEAVQYDNVVFKCYKAFVSLHNMEDPFENTRFLTLLVYQALLSNAINFKQLVAITELQNPPQLLIPKGSILLSDN